MKYRNTEPPWVPQDFGAVWKWAVSDRLMGRRREAPGRYSTPRVKVDGALLRPEVSSVVWVGHASWIVRLGGQCLYIDPVWSDALGPGVRRNVAPALPLGEAPPPDVVLVTHNHRDHLDAPTIAALGPAPRYLVPEGLGRFFTRRGCARVTECAWWQEVDLGTVMAAFVPSQHWSRRGALDANESLWGGFVLTEKATGRRVYHSGDTAWFGGFAEIGRRYPGIDAALLPIGAYDPEWFMRKQHMNPDDAVRAFQALGAARLCAMHWGTFKLTDEPLDEPPRLLEEARVREGIEAARVWVPPIGGGAAL